MSSVGPAAADGEQPVRSPLGRQTLGTPAGVPTRLLSSAISRNRLPACAP